MEHTEEANLGAQAFGIAGNFDQCFRTEAQQHCVDKLLVLQCELSQKARHGEYDVGIRNRKKFFLPPVRVLVRNVTKQEAFSNSRCIMVHCGV